ncbi:MAG: thermonuclease family protein [Gammaproteobacteria bacterium]|nr:thermonuclease family protein [Gammaproteobacteria bacterium]
MRWLFAALLAVLPLLAQAASCSADRINERVHVAHVHDGDTVMLSDGRKLRLIGIDTPELSRDGRPAEPLAEEAAAALRKLLADQTTIGLRLDAEPRDHYQRSLAHLFLQDGRSVEVWLLERGLATLFIVPPNVWNMSCYIAAEQHARDAGRGLWARAEYRVTDTTELVPGAEGVRLVRGRVIEVEESAKSLWLKLAGNVSVRVDRRDLVYFGASDPRSLLHGQVLVRGRLVARSSGWMLHVRHPVALQRLPGD